MTTKEEMVFALYARCGLNTEKVELATGIPADEISKMIQDNDWDNMVATTNMAPARLVAYCYNECTNIVSSAQRNRRPLSDAEVNRMAKLVATANKLDYEQSPGVHMEVLAGFNNYLVQRKPLLAKEIVEYELAFVREMIGKRSKLNNKTKAR